MKRHLEENFFEGGELDDVDDVMMIRTFVSSIIYSKEIDNWKINWPTDTKYMLRLRRLLVFIKRRMERRFTVTIATNSAVNTVNQMIHSDDETAMLSYFRRWSYCFLILCYP